MHVHREMCRACLFGLSSLTELCTLCVLVGRTSRDLLIAHQAKGAGYAMSRPEELQSILDVSDATGQSKILNVSGRCTLVR